MSKKIRWVTETAALLALLICLQAAGSLIAHPMVKQLVTGTFVNCVLAVSVLLVGMSSGITVALISPVCAFLFGIAPNFITVLPIMLGNVCYVVILKRMCYTSPKRRIAVLLGAAVAKFVVLYLLVVQLICGIASPALIGQKLGNIVVLAPPMLKMLPAMFSWPQLVTALTGGAIALLIFPTLKKALHK